MKELTLSTGVAVDCCWHDGAVWVASHVRPHVRVERLSADLSSVAVVMLIAAPGGNAAPRMCSWQNVLWLAYRDASDNGYLVRLDTGEVFPLGHVYGQRPFAFGDGVLAWQTSSTLTGLLDLENPIDKGHAVIPQAPTGLSHIDPAHRVWTWEELRQRHSWGAGWTVVNGTAEFAEGKQSGIVGQLIGTPGFFSLWADQQMRDPRVSSTGDSITPSQIAVVAWSPNGPIRVAVVTTADLVASLPNPVPAPSTPAPAPSTITQVGRPALWAYWKPVSPLGPCNAILIETQADLALANAHPTLPLIIVRPMLPACWNYWDRVYAVLLHEEGGQAAVEAQARLAILQIQAAGVPKRDVMTYTGANLHPSAKGVDIHGIQAYLPADTPNPAQAMRKLITDAAAKFGAKQRLVIHGQAYDRRTYNDPTRRPLQPQEGWTDVEGLKAIQAVYPALVKVDQRIVGCIWFCDGNRQGGTRDYPELVPYHARCVAVTPGSPPISVPAPPPPPPPHPDPPVPIEEPPVPTKCTIHPARPFDEVYPVVLAIDAWATQHARPLQAGEYFQIASMFLINGASNQKAYEWTKGHLGITEPIPADPT